jgi:asparagine synthase (glutamine-hydrolysing)
LKSTKFRFSVPHVDEMLHKTLQHSDEPFGSLSVVAQYGMFQTIREHTDAKVLLSGQGGDEVLLGYLKFFFFHLRELVRTGRYIGALIQILSSAFRRTVIRQFRPSEAKRYIPFLHGGNQKVLTGRYDSVSMWAKNGMRSRQIADIDVFSVPALTHYEDRNSMAQSLEVRHPFLDHRLVEFSLRLPSMCQFKGGWTKRVLREGFPELPDAVRWRRDKQGFTTPEELWLKRELTGLIEHTFQRSVLEEFGIVRSKMFLEQYRSYRRGNLWISFGDICRVFLAELWGRQHWPQAVND